MRLYPPVLIAAIGAAIVGAACEGLRRPNLAPAMTPQGVRFSFVDGDAKSVALTGAFNQWSATEHQLSRGAGKMWEITVRLPPGEYPFMFVVDGSRWITPPVADDFIDDGFGSKNGVVIVRPEEK